MVSGLKVKLEGVRHRVHEVYVSFMGQVCLCDVDVVAGEVKFGSRIPNGVDIADNHVEGVAAGINRK